MVNQYSFDKKITAEIQFAWKILVRIQEDTQWKKLTVKK